MGMLSINRIIKVTFNWSKHTLSEHPGILSLRKGQTLPKQRSNAEGAKDNFQEAGEVTAESESSEKMEQESEIGFSPTNGKKWFPKGCKATTQKQMILSARIWFQIILPVPLPKATRPHRSDISSSQTTAKSLQPIPKLVPSFPLQTPHRRKRCIVSTS